jgi:hypothetical protein
MPTSPKTPYVKSPRFRNLALLVGGVDATVGLLIYLFFANKQSPSVLWLSDLSVRQPRSITSIVVVLLLAGVLNVMLCFRIAEHIRKWKE